ncbi:NAD(P)-binding protein [Gonapodya prolifera JEL478]|uniref:NAD(P)-binding protein n=1 Tax=Gonapodya prolifera (strain JEL478) TaxID=1344416 RepID=A0A139AV06_GONPJ|nr:NAD(P)-binding protein [Gonapodya prolifera JEL478]|eukprot:KXS20534.1 NAD(P)-binding protein [Gonapodya prolifera JEL478]
MANQLRWDGRVVVVTGAGNGLGRAHALFFGSRGAKVVVNDLGGSAFGAGASSSAADKVVEEIRAAGGQAVANYDSVEFGDKIIETALKAFGRFASLQFFNNAGILRDKSFARMTEEDWLIIQKVHVYGTYKVTKAAWEVFEKQKFGRIINTASGAGVYGNFGQVNYSTAKLAVHGLTETLAQEGAKNNIFANTIAPLAGSRLTATVWDEGMLKLMKPEYITPIVAYLAHESSTSNGRLFELGGGWAAEIRWNKTLGHIWNTGPTFTPEAVAAAWDKVEDFKDSIYPRTNRDGINALQIIEASQKAPENPQGPAVRFDGKVVVITGAGNGLGKAYAKLFAKLGAKVVVNGMSRSSIVVDEIVAAGGVAVANFDNVLEGHKIIETAIKSFGRIDILINNAGILRDKSFRRMTDDDWKIIHDIHLTAVFRTTKAAWPYLTAQKSGVVICTSSTSIYGNFGQANYAAAKIGTIGFTNALSKEGAKNNIRVTSIAPAAGTRLTATVMPQEMLDLLKPDFVAPVVAYIASDQSKVTGGVFEVNAGWAAKLRWQRSAGAYFDFNGFTVEDVRDKWAELTNFDNGRATYPSTAGDSFPEIVKNKTLPKNLFPAQPRKAKI